MSEDAHAEILAVKCDLCGAYAHPSKMEVVILTVWAENLHTVQAPEAWCPGCHAEALRHGALG